MRRRGTIGRDEIVDAALAVADRDGLRGVTVRAVAAEVGVAPMSIYTYVTRKEQLLDRMSEHVIGRVFTPANRSTWQEELDTGARNARRTLLAHPQWLPLFTRVVIPVGSLGGLDIQLRRMRKGGLSIETAMRALSATIAFTLGMVLVERMMAGTGTPDTSIPLRQLDAVKTLLPTLAPRSYAQLALATARFTDWSFDDVFDAGLHSLIAGFEHDGARRRPAPRAAQGESVTLSRPRTWAGRRPSKPCRSSTTSR